jgi:hypothetical protein
MLYIIAYVHALELNPAANASLGPVPRAVSRYRTEGRGSAAVSAIMTSSSHQPVPSSREFGHCASEGESVNHASARSSGPAFGSKGRTGEPEAGQSTVAYMPQPHFGNYCPAFADRRQQEVLRAEAAIGHLLVQLD